MNATAIMLQFAVCLPSACQGIGAKAGWLPPEGMRIAHKTCDLLLLMILS